MTSKKSSDNFAAPFAPEDDDPDDDPDEGSIGTAGSDKAIEQKKAATRRKIM